MEAGIEVKGQGPSNARTAVPDTEKAKRQPLPGAAGGGAALPALWF